MGKPDTSSSFKMHNVKVTVSTVSRLAVFKHMLGTVRTWRQRCELFMPSEMGWIYMVTSVTVHTWRQRQNSTLSSLSMKPTFNDIEVVARCEWSLKTWNIHCTGLEWRRWVERDSSDFTSNTHPTSLRTMEIVCLLRGGYVPQTDLEQNTIQYKIIFLQQSMEIVHCTLLMVTVRNF